MKLKCLLRDREKILAEVTLANSPNFPLRSSLAISGTSCGSLVELGAVDVASLRVHTIQLSTLTTMSSVRIARAALRARSVAVARPIQRRGYADAVSDKIKLSLALPHQVRDSGHTTTESERRGQF